MSKIATLEDFLKNYLRNEQRPDGALSLTAYKQQKGYIGAKNYADAISAAMLKKRQASSNYGSIKTELADSGLSKSGYADYLNARAEANYRSTATELISDKLAAENRLQNDYTKYLEDYRDRITELKGSVRRELMDNEIVDTYTAYDYATKAGLSDADAKDLARTVYASMRSKMIQKVIDRVAALELTPEGVKDYAASLGLNLPDSEWVSKKAYELMNYYNKYTDDYLDYLKRLEKEAGKILG